MAEFDGTPDAETTAVLALLGKILSSEGQPFEDARETAEELLATPRWQDAATDR